MRTLKLTIAYDGTEYAGWQVQPRQRSIQGELERALQTILRQRVRVTGSGRTDAGVHALAQVAHIRTASLMPSDRMLRALNAVLPRDIVVRAIDAAPERFHARFSAVAKRYRYTVVTGPAVLPFDRLYVHHAPVPLNVALMRREAQALLGRHDVRVFHKLSRPVRDPRRTITTARITRRRPDRLEIELVADGFLHGMARSIAGTLLDVGRGHRPPGTMAAILRTRDRRLVGPAAPAKGLFLVDVMYRKRPA